MAARSPCQRLECNYGGSVLDWIDSVGLLVEEEYECPVLE